MKLPSNIFAFFAMTRSLSYAQQAQVNDTNRCNGQEWCVEFHSFSSTLGGSTSTNDDDVTILYDASAPTSDGTTKYYKISLLDGTACTSTIDTTTSGVSPVVAGGGVIPYSDYTTTNGSDSGTSGTLRVGLDIDTSKIETGGLQQNVSSEANTFEVRFCAKVDLWSRLDGTDYEVATSKTYLTLAFDKNLGFEFEITSSGEATGEDNANVALNYNLKSCICAIGAAMAPNFNNNNYGCLSSYTDLRPGDSFTFCVQSLDKDVRVTGLSNVAFKNSNSSYGSNVNIPILDAAGLGVGPASNADCTTQPGVCMVETVTYARMYEAVVVDDSGTSSLLVDISTTNYVEGTATLAFTNNRKRELLRRLGSSSVQQPVRFGSSFPSPPPVTTTTTTTTTTLDVASSSVPQRQLQNNNGGSTSTQDPVNDFEMEVNLATPPDRSSSSSRRSSSRKYSTVVVRFASCLVSTVGFVEGLLF